MHNVWINFVAHECGLLGGFLLSITQIYSWKANTCEWYVHIRLYRILYEAGASHFKRFLHFIPSTQVFDSPSLPNQLYCLLHSRLFYFWNSIKTSYLENVFSKFFRHAGGRSGPLPHPPRRPAARAIGSLCELLLPPQ
jgi:hypothetical protein